MFEETTKRSRNRIFYPSGSWFPLQSAVFEDVFPHLNEKRSRQLYMTMYECVRRPGKQKFTANLSDLARMLDCDARTARACIVELVGEGFVTMINKGGRLRSKTDKPIFTVPLAQIRPESGHWFPVPRFFVTEYLRKYRGSLVLIALLYHQHMRWKNYSWPGVDRLVKVLGLGRRSVFQYLHAMGHKLPWARLGTGLPWPVEITYSPDRKHRHFSVRAARFYTPEGTRKPVVTMREEFAIHFGFQKRKQISKAQI